MTAESDYYKNLDDTTLIKELITVSYAISDNDGRLTCGSSAQLDFDLDRQSEIEKEILQRMKRS